MRLGNYRCGVHVYDDDGVFFRGTGGARRERREGGESSL